MRHKYEFDSYHIADLIDESRMLHYEIADAIDMKFWSFSDRYVGRVKWRKCELKRLAPVIGCTLADLMR